MILNGKDQTLPLASSQLPDMGLAMADILQPVQFIQITKQNLNGLVQEIQTPINTRAVRQPYSPQRLDIKPEGQREWRWETVFASIDLILSPDDRILWDGLYFRVMQKSDYKEYGYVQYEIVQDYTLSPRC
jgi:hypothetical protein